MQDSSQWTKILSTAELDAYHASTAELDAAFAHRSREFYLSRTLGQLRALEHQAWLTCEPNLYQLARSYAALKGAEPA